MPRSFVALVIGVGMLLAACAPAAQPAAPTTVPTQAAAPAKKIGIAYSNLIADSLSLWVARESGIFAKNGLDVDLQYIASSNAFGALLAGQVQASSGGGSEVISGTANGDVSYRGQLDDDLADLVKGLGLDKQGVHRTLAGFSSGGGLVLRIAGGPQAGLFDDYLAISPYIAQDSPTNKPNSGGWASVAVPRIVALSLLEGVGLPWFQGLPAVHFATAAKADNNRTPVYSFRLLASLQLGRDWRAVLARVNAPTRIVVGADDELFNADQFQPMMQAINPRIGVTVVPNQGHLSMIADPAATTAIAAAWRTLAGD